MEQMRYYPLFLDLSRAVCLVIGAGRVGRRKIAALLECGAAGVVALDPFADAEKLQVLLKIPVSASNAAHSGKRTWPGKLWSSSAPRQERSTGLPPPRAAPGTYSAMSQTLRTKARSLSRHMWMPSSLSRPVHRRGKPRSRQSLKEDLETWLGGGYVPLARFLEKLRPILLNLGLGSDRNAEIFRALCSPEFRSCFRAAYAARDHKRILRMAEASLPPGLHGSLKELLNGLD